MLKFLNRLVLNAKFNIEDICNVYKRLKIEAGDDSDTLSYIHFMHAILPPSATPNISTMHTTARRPGERSPSPNVTIDVEGRFKTSSAKKRGLSMPYSSQMSTPHINNRSRVS